MSFFYEQMGHIALDLIEEIRRIEPGYNETVVNSITKMLYLDNMRKNLETQQEKAKLN